MTTVEFYESIERFRRAVYRASINYEVPPMSYEPKKPIDWARVGDCIFLSAMAASVTLSLLVTVYAAGYGFAKFLDRHGWSFLHVLSGGLGGLLYFLVRYRITHRPKNPPHTF